MKKLIMAGAAAMALTAMPTMAQEMGMDAEAYTMTEAQTSMYDGWPADRRASYDGWPMDVQEYYWTLTPEQVEGWWVLTDPQRMEIYNRTPQQRTAAWRSVLSQINSSASAATSARATGTAGTGTMGTTASTGTTGSMAATTSGNMRFVRSEVVQTTPTPRTPNSEYPPCRGDMQDSCVNPREAGLDYGNRPLGYWPGRPASEIEGPLPAEDPND